MNAIITEDYFSAAVKLIVWIKRDFLNFAICIIVGWVDSGVLNCNRA